MSSLQEEAYRGKHNVKKLLRLTLNYFINGGSLLYYVKTGKYNPLAVVLAEITPLVAEEPLSKSSGIQIKENSFVITGYDENEKPTVLVVNIREKKAYRYRVSSETLVPIEMRKYGIGDAIKELLTWRKAEVFMLRNITGSRLSSREIDEIFTYIFADVLGELLHESLKALISPPLSSNSNDNEFNTSTIKYLVAAYGSIRYAVDNNLVLVYASRTGELDLKIPDNIIRADSMKSYPAYITCKDGTLFTIPRPLKNSFFSTEKEILYYEPKNIPEKIIELFSITKYKLPVIMGLYI